MANSKNKRINGNSKIRIGRIVVITGLGFIV